MDATAAAAAAPSAYKTREKRFKQLSDAQIRADADVIDVRAAARTPGALRVGTWHWTSAIATADAGRERPVLSLGGRGEHHDGFFAVPDALDAATQLEIAHACLTQYVEPPHVTNLQEQPTAPIWRTARRSHPQEPAKAPVLSKLHWGAAGFHYDWTARKYYAQAYSPMPPLLAALGQQCAMACGETLEAEAVIVNFYKKSSTMGGHQDDVELTMAHPVVSLSLGSDCVFLKGTTTKEDAPLEVLLRTGDLAVLSGASRLSFHGIAQVLPTTFEISEEEMNALVNKKMNEDNEETNQWTADEWRDELCAVQRYLSTHRININIRQVYATGERPDTEASTTTPAAVAAETEAAAATAARQDEDHASKRQKV